jgi:hypothetical protein
MYHCTIDYCTFVYNRIVHSYCLYIYIEVIMVSILQLLLLRVKELLSASYFFYHSYSRSYVAITNISNSMYVIRIRLSTS